MSFQGQNLTGANFTDSNISGCNFNNTILGNANFSHAKSGLSQQSYIYLLIFTLLLIFTSGLGSGLTGSWISNLLLNANDVFVRYKKINDLLSYSTISGSLALGVLIIVLILIIQSGLKALIIGAITTLIIGIICAVTIINWASQYTSIAIAGDIGVVVCGAAAVAVILGLGSVFLMAFAITLAKVSYIYNKSLMTAFYIAGIFGAMTLGILAKTTYGVLIGIWIGGLLIIPVALYITTKTIFSDQRYSLIRKIAILIGSIGGTSFKKADLTDANFSNVVFKNTDLTSTNITRTNFYQAKNLNYTQVKNTILVNPLVTELLVNKKINHNNHNILIPQDLRKKYLKFSFLPVLRILAVPLFHEPCVSPVTLKPSYINCNFQGANLQKADLRSIDLTGSNFNDATLEGANLENCNLSKIQALNTNFQDAILTAACLEGWNIDSKTNLDNVICDYVYLKNNNHHLQERRPSSGIFAPGDFTKLFQEVIDTVDFIFRNGVDWKAFSYSLHQLQIDADGQEISIRSIENRGDGVVLVKVNVPPELDKGKLHQEFVDSYQLALTAIEEKYQAELTSKDEQIAIYRQHQADLKELTQTLLENFSENISSRRLTKLETKSVSLHSDANKLVVLNIGAGNLEEGFPVTLQIGEEGCYPSKQCNAKLTPATYLASSYYQWQSAYNNSVNYSLSGNVTSAFRIEIAQAQVTNISQNLLFGESHATGEKLKNNLNSWLNTEEFRPIKEEILAKLNANDSIRIIIQTENSILWRLPWSLWEVCDRYPKAEVAISTLDYELISQTKQQKNQLNILAILGDSKGINLDIDKKILAQLPEAKVNFIIEPQRKELNDQLWTQPWDILFFAGHSSSHPDIQTGRIHINKNDTLTIPELKNALKKAITQGLQLAIFNSCDGLGLGVNLLDLHIPQMIVMREPVADKVAQEFLKNFLITFSSGATLYESVRDAREKLQGLEDKYPACSWLPVIFQNPGAIPPKWQDLK